jgi:hypothetical protein
MTFDEYWAKCLESLNPDTPPAAVPVARRIAEAAWYDSRGVALAQAVLRVKKLAKESSQWTASVALGHAMVALSEMT